MKAIQFYEYGDADVLRMENLPVPEPAEGEVLIRVKAIGVNFSDTERRRNAYPYPSPLPFIPGFEVAGIIERLGEGVQRFCAGERVIAFMQSGGYAEYVAVPHNLVMVLPEGVDFEVGAMLPVQGLTAFYLLKTACLKPKETVLIPGAAGGVGTLALQLAKILCSAHVVATAGSPEKLELAHSLGADSLVNYHDTDWQEQVMQATQGKGADVILEMIGGEVFQKSLACLATQGRLIVYSRMSSEQTVFDPIALILKNQTVIGFNITGFLENSLEYVEPLHTLFEYVKQGQLKVHIGGVYPLEQAAKVHRLIESRSTKGKLILQP